MKALSLGFIAMAGLALVSCDMDTENKVTTTYSTVNIVSPTDAPAVTASEGNYSIELNFTKATAQVSTQDFAIGTQKFTYNGSASLSQGSDGYIFNSLAGNMNGTSTYPVKNAKFQLAYGILGQEMVVGNFQLGDEYMVYTIPSVNFYAGITSTTYPMMGEIGHYENKNMYYGIKFDIDKKKADLIMYNAKFSNSEKEPEKNVYVSELDLTFRNGGFSLHGENITPKLMEGGTLEDYPSFNIKEFDMQSDGDDLMGAYMNYTVLHTMTMGDSQPVTVTYTGKFSGSAYFSKIPKKD